MGDGAQRAIHRYPGSLRMLNKLWLGFFLTAAAAALYRWLVIGDPEVFRLMVASLFDWPASRWK